jgi:hypothetical protein
MLFVGSQIEYKYPTIPLGPFPQKVHEIFKVLLALTDLGSTNFQSYQTNRVSIVFKEEPYEKHDKC